MPIHFTTEPYTLTHLFPLWYNETMKLLRYLLLSDVALFTLIPLLLRFINKDVALGAMLVLYYGVYPIHFAVIGFFSGKEKLPYLPIVTFGIFLASMFFLFRSQELSYIQYGFYYLSISFIVMGVAYIVNHIVKKQ